MLRDADFLCQRAGETHYHRLWSLSNSSARHYPWRQSTEAIFTIRPSAASSCRAGSLAAVHGAEIGVNDVRPFLIAHAHQEVVFW